MSFKHQGDITFYPTKKTEGKAIKHIGSYCLALGTKTGHQHVITSRGMKISKNDAGIVFITLTKKGKITHEEHLPIELVPGKYRIGKEREMDHFSKSIRQIID